MVMAIDPKVIFERLDGSIAKSVRLWVMCGGELEPYTQFVVEGYGEFWGELWIAIWDDMPGESE